MDQQIRQFRRELWSAKTDELAYEKLVEIDKLQRQRKLLTGEFLPDRNGEVYIYDTDLERWFKWWDGVR